MNCTLCKNNSVDIFMIIDNKTYWECKKCFVKFLDKKHYLDRHSEKNHYLKHENNIKDKRYQNFLSKLYIPLKKKLSINDKGLDFGCGHGPALAYMFKMDGFNVDIYDPFFYSRNEIFLKKYDFISCTEVVEHFWNPLKEFDILNNLLKKSGWLGIMTCFYEKNIVFKNWHYRRDPTHVTFYSAKTFEYIADKQNWMCEIKTKDVVLFKKK